MTTTTPDPATTHASGGTDAVATATGTVDAWLATYTETDRALRRPAVQRLWHPEGRLIEPPLDTAGHDGVDHLAEAVQAQFAGCSFRRTSELDLHHATARYEWELVGTDGSVTLSGEDVVRFHDDGRLLEVVGFFGRPAPRA